MIYIYCDEEIRKERAKKRPNFDETEWERRRKDDDNVLSLTEFIGNFYDVTTRVYDNIKPMDYCDIAKDIVSRS